MNHVHIGGYITDFTDSVLKVNIEGVIVSVHYHPNTFTETFKKGIYVEIHGRLTDHFNRLNIIAERIKI